jgi:hypothetical protein
MTYLFFPMVILTGFPWLALIPAALCFFLYRRTRVRVALFTCMTWSFYCVYEFLMKWRVLCTGECNIRVDLLLLAPVLYVLTIATLIAAYRKRR